MFFIIAIGIMLLFAIFIVSSSKNTTTINENIEISDEIYKKLEEENQKQKIRNYVEKMTLFELQQMLPDDIFTKLPKKREAMINEVIRLIETGEIEFKNNNSSYYVNSDKIAENDKDYYNKDFKEKQDDIKHFEPIKKYSGISINMDLFNNIQLSIEEEIKSEECASTDLEDKIKYALTLEPIKKNLNTFYALLDEYNNLDIDSKSKISRKYTSQLEALKNKAERS